MVLQPGCDEEENVVGAFSNSDTELLDSDNDYILVHDDEWLGVIELLLFFTPLGYLLGLPVKKKKSVMKIKCKVKLTLKIMLYSF